MTASCHMLITHCHVGHCTASSFYHGYVITLFSLMTLWWNIICRIQIVNNDKHWSNIIIIIIIKFLFLMEYHQY
jgi:hypothetical protein